MAVPFGPCQSSAGRLSTMLPWSYIEIILPRVHLRRGLTKALSQRLYLKMLLTYTAHVSGL